MIEDRKPSPALGRSVRRIAGAAVGLVALLALSGAAQAAEVHVMISGGFTAAYQSLVPGFEKATGNKTSVAFGASMGTTPTAIPIRLARGEPDDVVIMVGYALDDLIKAGLVVPGSKVELGVAHTVLAVKAGAPKPDISTVDALKHTLLTAKSIGYSDSASGVYLSKELFPKLGVADQIKGKAKQIDGTPVGLNVASGDVEIGFQQRSEMMTVPGIDIVGPLPPGADYAVVYAAGVATNAKEPQAARALIVYLASPAAADMVRKSGMELPGAPAAR